MLRVRVHLRGCHPGFAEIVPQPAEADDDMFGAFVPNGRFMLAATGRGPLHGKRFAVKDLIDVAGHRTGGGNPDWRATAKPAMRHAAAVAQLLDAGAEIIGKTITDELAFSLEGANAHYGTPVNPRDPAFLPGGSSSGSAVAVAARLCDFALGTDTGGSIRVPAAFCGIYGLRPSHDTVSTEGVIPFAPSYDTLGWFAREAELLAQIGDVLLPPSQSKPIVSVHLVEDAIDHLDAESASDIKAAAKAICNGPPVRVFEQFSLDEIFEAYQALQCLDIKHHLGLQIETLRPLFGPSIAERFAGALSMPDARAEPAGNLRDRLRQRMTELCPPGTALLMPVSPHRKLARDVEPKMLGAFYRTALGLNAVAGHCGLPQLQMAADDGDGRLAPSLIGAKGSDRDLLHFVAGLSRERGETNVNR